MLFLSVSNCSPRDSKWNSTIRPYAVETRERMKLQRYRHVRDFSGCKVHVMKYSSFLCLYVICIEKVLMSQLRRGVQCHLDWTRGVFPGCFGACPSSAAAWKGQKGTQSRVMGSCPWLNNLRMIISGELVSQIWQKFVGMVSAAWFTQKMQPCLTYCQCPHLSQMALLSDKILGILVKPSSASVREREVRAQALSWCLNKHPLPIYIWIWLKNEVGFSTAPLCRPPEFSLSPGLSLLLLSLPPSTWVSECILGLRQCEWEGYLAHGHLEFTDKESQMSFSQVMKFTAPLRLLSQLAGDLESPLCLVQASIKQCKIGPFIIHFRV